MAPPDLLLRGTSICVPSIFCLLHTSSPSHTYNYFVMMGRRFMLEVILNFLSNTYVGQPTLQTRKIDQHIARLRQYDWFHIIYYDEPYRSLFFSNRHVRKYLQLFV